jgi:hypothetical protein
MAFRRGDRVQHPRFGLGRYVHDPDVTGLCDVAFDNVGDRWDFDCADVDQDVNYQLHSVQLVDLTPAGRGG